MDNLLKLASEHPELAFIALISTIVLLATILALFFVALQQGREIHFWKLKLGKPQKSGVGVAQFAEADIQNFAFRIRTPMKDAPVDPNERFAVTGTYKEVPEGFVPWTFTTNTSHPTKWWPQKEVDPDPDADTWTGLVHGIGPNPSTGERYFGVFLVGPDGQALLRYRKEIAESSGKWGPLTELTRDIYECQIVRVSVPRQGKS